MGISKYQDDAGGSSPIVYLTRVALQALITGSTLDTTVTYAITDALGATEVMFVWASGVNTLYTTGVAQTNSYFGIYNIGADTFIQGYIPAIASPAQGDVIYHNGTIWTRLAAGTAGQYLQTNGAGSNPTWDTPVPQDSTVLCANLNAGQVAGGVTNYFTFFGSNASLGITTESLRQIPAPEAMTLSRLYFRTSSAQSGTGSLVINIRINGANSGITITIPAASGAGTFTDLVNTAAVAAGDLISIQIINNASAAGAQMNGWTIVGTR